MKKSNGTVVKWVGLGLTAAVIVASVLVAYLTSYSKVAAACVMNEEKTSTVATNLGRHEKAYTKQFDKLVAKVDKLQVQATEARMQQTETQRDVNRILLILEGLPIRERRSSRSGSEGD